MNQKKIGGFLKELRNEHHLTQEQLAEIMGVSNRSVSRWENGVNMPDFDLLIEMATYYDVSMEELLDGERKQQNKQARIDETMDKHTAETLWKVADYNNNEKQQFTKRIHYLFLIAIGAFVLYMIIDISNLALVSPYEEIGSCMLGFVFGVILTGALYTSRYMTEIRIVKMRLLHRKSDESIEP